MTIMFMMQWAMQTAPLLLPTWYSTCSCSVPDVPKAPHLFKTLANNHGDCILTITIHDALSTENGCCLNMPNAAMYCFIPPRGDLMMAKPSIVSGCLQPASKLHNDGYHS